MPNTMLERGATVAQECIGRGIREGEIRIMQSTIYYRGVLDARQGLSRNVRPPDEARLTQWDYEIWSGGFDSLVRRVNIPLLDLVSDDQIVIDLSDRS